MYPTRHVLLRDRRSWQAPSWPTELHALHDDDDGNLSLQRLPKPLQPVQLPPPYEVEASGLASAPCLGLFIADTAHDRVIFRDDYCCDEAQVAPILCDCGDGHGFSSPRGLAYGAHGLAVADSGNARILRHRAETLLLRGSVHGPLNAPHAVAVDALGRWYVLDAASQRVYRLQANGVVDGDYTDAVAAEVVAPRFLALDGEGHLWLSDADDDRVHRFDADGVQLQSLPAAEAGWRPRALAVADTPTGTRAYVADAHGGWIFAYDGDDCMGPLPAYRGPVTALAIGDDGSLYIKPGADEQVIVACADAGVVAFGELRAGPLDAGERSDWERVALEVDVPDGAQVELALFCTGAAAPGPADNEWVVAPGTDVLLETFVASATPGPGSQRHLWLRVRLRPAPDGGSPQLRQVQAATADEDYRRWLPSVFAEHDDASMLERLLALARSEIGAAETAIADLPRLAAPEYVPMASLPWLAEWLDFQVPLDLPSEQRRVVLRDAHRLLRKRGTVVGLLSLIHLQTGIRPRLLEWPQHRRIWQLGATSALGFDTALPAASADGIVVADADMRARTDPAQGCAAPERIVIGRSVVGLDRPESREDFGTALFEEHAHRISVWVSPGQASEPAMRERLRAVVEAEKPAHVVCEVCFVEAEMRIGMAARVGIDAVIAGEGDRLRLSLSALGHDAHLGGTAPPTGTVGWNARLGTGLVLG